LKYTIGLLSLTFLMSFTVQQASAQARVDLNIGFGTAFDATNNHGIDNANSTNSFNSRICWR
jgi:hypothetical protein